MASTAFDGFSQLRVRVATPEGHSGSAGQGRFRDRAVLGFRPRDHQMITKIAATSRGTCCGGSRMRGTSVSPRCRMVVRRRPRARPRVGARRQRLKGGLRTRPRSRTTRSPSSWLQTGPAQSFGPHAIEFSHMGVGHRADRGRRLQRPPRIGTEDFYWSARRRLSPSVCVALRRHGVRQKEEQLHADPTSTSGTRLHHPARRDASSSTCFDRSIKRSRELGLAISASIIFGTQRPRSRCAIGPRPSWRARHNTRTTACHLCRGSDEVGRATPNGTDRRTRRNPERPFQP